MSAATALQSKKILSQMANLRDLAKKGKWEFAYDQDTDQLFYAPTRIPKGTRLMNFGKEFALYLDDSSNVKGLFVEYFTTNFTEHEEGFKKIIDLLDDEEDGFKTAKNNDSEDVKLAENALTGEAFKNVYAFFEKIDIDEQKASKKKGSS